MLSDLFFMLCYLNLWYRVFLFSDGHFDGGDYTVLNTTFQQDCPRLKRQFIYRGTKGQQEKGQATLKVSRNFHKHWATLNNKWNFTGFLLFDFLTGTCNAYHQRLNSLRYFSREFRNLCSRLVEVPILGIMFPKNKRLNRNFKQVKWFANIQIQKSH